MFKHKEVLVFQKITKHGFQPTKGSDESAGYDLYSAYDYVIPSRGKQLIKTDIKLCIPRNCYGRVAPRSGLAWKHSLDVGGGVIDSDYRGNIRVILFNHSDKDFNIKAGERIAQLIIEKIADTELIEGEVNLTERQENGFGSTGL